MLNLEQLTEKSLQANFTEVQQRHFDRLMSELEVISDGLGFAELKTKAEAGDKEALQVMRDYISKKEQIVEFIEKKELPEVNELRDEELKVGDEVFILENFSFGATGKILSIPRSSDSKAFMVDGIKDSNNPSMKEYGFEGRLLAKNKSEKYNADRLGEIDLLDLKKYNDITVGDIYRSEDGKGEIEVVGLSMPINAKIEDGLLIVYKIGNGQTYAKLNRWFRRDLKARNYRKA